MAVVALLVLTAMAAEGGKGGPKLGGIISAFPTN